RLAELRAAHGYTLVHPFDDAQVVAGAAPAPRGLLPDAPRIEAPPLPAPRAWERLEDAPGIEALAVPASGGGLLGGALLAVRGLAPGARVWGVQPAGADGIVRSLAAGEPTAPERIETVADGLTAPRPGVLNFELIRGFAAGVLTVADPAILAAMGRILRALRVIVEPAGAAGLAGVLAHPELFRGRRVGILLSGGNTGAERVREVLASPAA